MLVIAHRLSTVIGATKVCVVEGGRVVEQGTHHELMRVSGRYAQLVAKQLQASDSSPAETLMGASASLEEKQDKLKQTETAAGYIAPACAQKHL